jgi:hypothetical protein
MAFNISTFRSQGVPEGGARPTQFDVNITLPQGLSTTGVAQRIKFTARATALPASIIESVSVPYFGRQIKVNGDRVFQDWTITVLNDEDFAVRNIMEQWSNIINTHISNRLDPEYKSITPKATGKSYKAIAEVYQYGKTGPGDSAGIIRSYKFDGIFPTVISEINLDWEAVNQIENFQVTFAYDWWIPIPKGGTAGSDDFGILSDDR